MTYGKISKTNCLSFTSNIRLGWLFWSAEAIFVRIHYGLMQNFRTTVPKTAYQLPLVRGGNVKMESSWGEIFNDDIVAMTMSFWTGGVQWNSGTFVQNYLSIEDPLAPGFFSTFTCNAEYKRNQDADVTVKNFYGNSSW